MITFQMNWSFYLTLLFAVVAVSTTPIATKTKSSSINDNSKATKDYLLPINIVPIDYKIGLVPILNNTPTGWEDYQFKFAGIVIINVTVARSTNMIRMHAKNLNIRDLKVMQEGSAKPIQLQDPPYTISDDDTQFLTIHTNRTLELGMRCKIEINYIGELNDFLYGFYRSDYKENSDNPEDKWLAVTQFESTGARWAFPCWDEPIWKAQFSILIAHDPITTVLSNMPVKFRNPDDNIIPKVPKGWEIVEFEKTHLMSTYLIAFAVSEFHSYSDPGTAAAPNVTYTDWARPDLVNYTHQSNQFAPKAIKHMEEYTGQLYSLNKLDQISIPDFAAGAMENWGLVTYREPYVLYKEGVTPTDKKMGVDSIIAHELAHQWFGNLVSPKWWNHIWLNEGFATYFSYYILDKEYPANKKWDTFTGEMRAAFQFDGRETTHPMLVPADSPSSINSVFDTIAYSKGACIIRMMEHTLGAEVFKQGIKNYLDEMKYGNAGKNDLWRNLEAAIPPEQALETSLPTVMDTWVVQSGVPVITVTRDYDAKTAAVTQKRFFTLPTETESSEVWWVPLTMTTETTPNFDDTSVQLWHKGEDLILDIDLESEKWLLFNVQQVGYYRVNYDLTNWQLLIDALLIHDPESTTIHAINRAQIMDDALALARASLLDYPTALDSTSYLANEHEYTPWSSGLGAMSYVHDRIAYEDADREAYEYFMLGSVQPVYDYLGGLTVNETDDDMKRIFRSLIYSWSCKLNNDTCNADASALFNNWMADPTNATTQIDPDLKSVVYCAGIHEGNNTHYDFLDAQYEMAQYKPGETSLILNSLSCSTNLTRLELYLNESIAEPSKVRKHDARTVLTAVYNNYVAVDLALDFFLNNYEACKAKYGQSGAESVFTGIANKLNTQEHRDKLVTFGEANNETLSDSEKNALNQAIMIVDEILAWHTAYYQTVTSYFRSKIPPPEPNAGPALLSSHILAFTALALAVLLGRP